jgi:hypothetical protein
MCCFFITTLFIPTASASQDRPVAISPGNDIGLAVVQQCCPTFSWTAVAGANAYRIEVFGSTGDSELTDHNDAAIQAHPVLVKEIPGAALSWTPSSANQLQNERIYVWFVQAIDDFGNAAWSDGKTFTVDLAAAFAPIEGAVVDSLEDAGVDKDIISDVLKNIRQRASEESSPVPAPSTPISVQGTEGTLDTFYGSNAGFSDTATSSYNSFFGAGAGYTTSTGQQNSFLGYYAGYTNDGYGNTFLGHYAGRLSTSGSYNLFAGAHSGGNNTTGGGNVFLGSNSAHDNTEGSDNVFAGQNSGFFNTSGGQNTLIGKTAGFKNEVGNHITMIGYQAGYNNTTGFNTFMGSGSGYYNTTGGYNTFMGYHTGYQNTTGQYNLFLGHTAGGSNQTGNENTFLGYRAGYFNGDGDNNVYIGHRAGDTATGSGNVFLGNQAGYNETGSNLLYIDNSNTSAPLIWGDFANDILSFTGTIGVGTKTPGFPMEMKKTGANASIVVDRTDGATNYINATDSFGNFGTVTDHPLRLVTNSQWRMRLSSDNSLTMKSGATCTAAGVWTNASSRALKENIQDLSADEAIGALDALAPVRYNYLTDEEDEYVGFIAEDVPELVASKDRKGMSAMDVVAVLTKVLQEQRKTVRDQSAAVERLEAVNTELRRRIEELESRIGSDTTKK